MTVAAVGLLALFAVLPTPTPAAVAGNQQADAARNPATPPPAEVFLDPAAQDLYEAAAAQWRRLDESIVSYAARVQQRLAAAVRLPLKDRTVYAGETALRVFWRRDKHPIVQVLGMRSRDPTGTTQPAEDRGWLNDLPFNRPFDPGADRLLFGLAKTEDRARTELRDMGPIGVADDFWFAHPLAADAHESYRYQSGDTVALRFPDGRELRTVQLHVLPLRADPHRIAGTLWIEPESGALVRAVYRLSRELDVTRDTEEGFGDSPLRFMPFARPLTMDLSLLAVDYALWDFKAWLPRTMRLEAEIRAGLFRFPASFEQTYRIESVTTAADVAAGGDADFPDVSLDTEAEASAFAAQLASDSAPPGGRESFFIVPQDLADLTDSPHLPPPIWEDAPAFLSEAQLDAFAESLARLPRARRPALAWSMGWPWNGRGLLRYNRVEGLAPGLRAAWQLDGRHAVSVAARLGLSDLRPQVRVELERQTVLRRLAIEAFDETQATDPAGGYLGTGNSASAFFAGRDRGRYYRSTGLGLVWRPPAADRESVLLRGYAERHRSLRTEAGFALFKARAEEWVFPPNPAVDEGTEFGVEMRVSPWWGTEASGVQFGLDVTARAARWRPSDGGPRENYATASATLRAALPLFATGMGRWRLGAETGAGTTWGRALTQRAWHLGGARTLRGHSDAALAGPAFARGRVEASWSVEFAGLGVFLDGGWAGDPGAFRAARPTYGAGVGLTLLDGLIRVDLARGLHGSSPPWRTHFHLDSIL